MDKPTESAERQAKVFAAAFLIDRAAAEALPDQSAPAISAHFDVSMQSAEIFVVKRERAASKAESIERVTQKAAAFYRRAVPDAVRGAFYLTDPCPTCGQRTLLQEGTLFRCTTCRRVGDPFQDGDRVA